MVESADSAGDEKAECSGFPGGLWKASQHTEKKGPDQWILIRNI